MRDQDTLSSSQSLDLKWPMAIVGLILAMAYGFTISDKPQLEDDGLFILASYFTGFAHAPGYPAFTLLSQPLQWLPFESVALKVHLFNALCGIGLCLTLLGFQKDRFRLVAVVLGILSLGVSPLFWEQAIIAETYMLNAWLTLMLLWWTYYLGTPNEVAKLNPVSGANVALLGLLFGTALSNHWPLVLLVSPAFLILCWPNLLALLKLAHWGFLGLVMGLLPYLWMYLKSSDDGFSHVGTFSDLSELVWFVSRQVFSEADNQLVTLQEKWLYAQLIGHGLISQFTLPGFVLVCLGFVWQWQKFSLRLAWALSSFILLPIWLLVLVDFPYTPIFVASFAVYLLPLYMVMAIWLVVGLDGLAERSEVLSVITAVVVLVLTTWQGFPRSNSDWGFNQTEWLLDTLPQNADVFVMDDWQMALLAYAHLVEGQRQDLRVYSEYGTFLPERLFPYEWDQERKNEALKQFRRSGDRGVRPLVVFQNPERFGSDYQAEPYYFVFDTTSNKQMPPWELMQDVGEGRWAPIYKTSLLGRWLDGKTTLPDALAADPEANLLMAEQLLDADAIEVAVVDHHLQMAEAGNGDRWLKTKLEWLQGRLMLALREEGIAETLFQESMKTLPVHYNPALDYWLGILKSRCDLVAFEATAARFDLELDPSETTCEPESQD